MMVTLTEMPPAIAKLPRDERGYPVPWFVAWVDGKPEFRCADGKKFAQAIQHRLCWVCGEKLDAKRNTFVIGPMCCVNRNTAEPPCHAECAEWSVVNCPFLSKPKAVRRDANMPEGGEVAGFSIDRNPGVTCLWYCTGYKLASDGRGGILFDLPGPYQVRWWREGRKATRDEIMESINTGVPLLMKIAEQDGPESVSLLKSMVRDAMKFVPVNKF